MCKNGDPQVLDKLLEKKLLPGVEIVNISTIFYDFIALCLHYVHFLQK